MTEFQNNLTEYLALYILLFIFHWKLERGNSKNSYVQLFSAIQIFLEFVLICKTDNNKGEVLFYYYLMCFIIIAITHLNK